MEESDKLSAIVQRMSPSQLKQLIRFAEFLMLEDEPDDLRDRTDLRVRYGTFKEVMQNLNIDPGTIEAWAQQTSDTLKSDR